MTTRTIRKMSESMVSTVKAGTSGSNLRALREWQIRNMPADVQIQGIRVCNSLSGKK